MSTGSDIFPNGSRRVLVLRLGVWGLGVDANSVRSVRGRKSSPNAELSRFWARAASWRRKKVNSHRDRGIVVAKRRTVLAFDSRLVLASQKCQRSQGSGGSRGREKQNCRHLWTRVWSSVSKVSTVTGIGGVVVAKCRTVVTFGLGREAQKRGERRGEERRENRKEG